MIKSRRSPRPCDSAARERFLATLRRLSLAAVPAHARRAAGSGEGGPAAAGEGTEGRAGQGHS